MIQREGRFCLVVVLVAGALFWASVFALTAHAQFVACPAGGPGGSGGLGGESLGGLGGRAENFATATGGDAGSARGGNGGAGGDAGLIGPICNQNTNPSGDTIVAAPPDSPAGTPDTVVLGPVSAPTTPVTTFAATGAALGSTGAPTSFLFGLAGVLLLVGFTFRGVHHRLDRMDAAKHRRMDNQAMRVVRSGFFATNEAAPFSMSVTGSFGSGHYDSHPEHYAATKADELSPIEAWRRFGRRWQGPSSGAWK